MAVAFDQHLGGAKLFVTPLMLKAGARDYREWEADAERRNWPNAIGELTFRIYEAMEGARHFCESQLREGDSENE